MGKTNNIFGIVIAGLIILVGILFLAMPIQEGFKGGKGKSRVRGKRGGTRRTRGGGKRFIRAKHPFRRNIRKRGGGKFYRRSGYRRYPYYGYSLGYGYNRYRPYYGYGLGYGYNGYRYPWYSWLSPFNWGSPYGYSTYNWFDYRNCPSGCVANSFSPSGYTCRGDGTISSCVTDYDCSGCNNPIVPYY